ncbi:MAG: 2,3-bisphosphoglycerate-dependent phosphoglycerate mutase [Candidatus Nasuia deltocephalinicola]
MKNIFKIVLVRHGESLGNLDYRFTGWLDVDLTNKGFLESYRAGVKLKNFNYNFDVCYTSKLKRAIKTANTILDALNLNHIKIIKTVDLNERFYGDLLGMDKLEASLKYGRLDVNSWLNNYDSRPPALSKKDKRYKLLKNKYKKDKIPLTESLEDVLKRVVEFWNKTIIKKIRKKKILIVAHSNILKILINHINDEKKNEILENSKPIIYEFDENLKKVKWYSI